MVVGCGPVNDGTPRHATVGAAPLKHVPALDGVRGIAIALVLAYHFEVPGVRGGFLGVDLFFVLSGFLITTLLLDEHRASSRIDLVGFWYRRARRLLPALFLLIAVVVIVAVWATPIEKGELRWDLLAALGYAANWRFIAAGQSYFNEFMTASPVRHLWSLAIEEQFYLAWPLIVSAGFVALWVGTRVLRGWKLGAALLGIAALGSAALMALTYHEADPSLAYFSTFARAHELLVGALAAVLLAHVSRMRSVIGQYAGAIAATGLLAVLIAGVLTGDTDAAYYLGGSLLFSLAAAALIVALVVGATSRGSAHRILRLRPLVWLGVISYGVYLWHWPLTIWLRPEIVHVDGPLLFALRLGATLLIASASFYLVERPIRRGTLGPIRLRPAIALVAAVAGFAVLSTGTVLATRGWEPLPIFLTEDPVLQVNPVDDSVGTVALVGDSVALSIYPGMRREAAALGLTTVSAAVPGCGVGDALRIEETGILQWKTERCAETIPALQTQMIHDHDPDVVFWHSQRDRYDIRDAGLNLYAPTSEWRRALYADWDETLERLRAGGAKVVLILPLFAEKTDPNECGGQEGLETPECVDPILSNGALRTIYNEWAATHPDDLVVIDEAARMCPEAPCPAVLDGVNLRRDHIHFSAGGGALLTRWLFDRLPEGVLPKGR
jgi:peptidoglycan/LPS O-acetylase OafA/YrhL